MIRPRYTLLLARTKLRSKQGILITSIIIASLLFAALIAATIIFNGAEKSALTYIQKSGNNRYLVRATPSIPWSTIDIVGKQLSLEQIKEIETFEKDYYTKQQARYASLNIKYDKSIEVPALQPASWLPDSLPEEQRVIANFQSPAIAAFRAERFANYAKTATNTTEDLKKLGEAYGATGFYGQSLPTLPPIPNTRLIQDGKEDFGSELITSDSSNYGFLTSSVRNSMYGFEDEHLLGRYLLPSDGRNAKGIPVIITAQEAAILFGKQFAIGEEPKDASAKSAWLRDIQAKLNGYTYQACYRNTAEQEMLSKIQRDYVSMKSHKNTSSYTEPDLLYDYPTTLCGNITVKKDTRTAEEKKAALDTEETQRKLGVYTAPNHQLLTFQIVGLINGQPSNDTFTDVDSYLKNLLSPQNALSSAIIPTQSYKALPESLKFNTGADATKQYTTFNPRDEGRFSPRVLEFTSIEAARTFLSKETCPSSDADCNKQFKGDPYGSNYLILDEIGKIFTKVMSIAFPAILGLATIIIWFTISRIISESRKETAIYRAMGAKRIDITAIYGTYMLLIALQIILVAFVIGISVAYIVNIVYGPQLTNTAAAAFGIIDTAPQFSLFSLSSPLLAALAISIVIVSTIASIQPLVRNVLRPPIRDIRDE